MALYDKKDGIPDSSDQVPRFNTSPLIDVPTGIIQKCIKGDTILIGGSSSHNGSSGGNNTGKSGLVLSEIARAMIRMRHLNIDAQMADFENNNAKSRIRQVFFGVAVNDGFSYEEAAEIADDLMERFVFINGKDVTANEWYDNLDEAIENRVKKKIDTFVAPYLGINKVPYVGFLPHFAFCDSFSAMVPDTIMENFLEENTAGSSDNNTMYLKGNGAKKQMLMRWVNTLPKGGVYLYTTAHLGDNISLDPKSPPEKKNLFMKQNHKLVDVPKQYYSYTTRLMFINGSHALVNSNKEPQYPSFVGDKEKRDAKDMEIELIFLRNKFGQSGGFIGLVYNQNQGVNWPLSEFHYCRVRRWGMGGNDQTYFFNLLPDVNLSRTTIKRKLLEDYRVRRVAEITCEMMLLYRYHFDSIDPKLRCSAEELYLAIKALGYDWDKLLDTRGYWLPDHYENPVKPLSTFDLLRMRYCQYVPYWLEEDEIPETVKKVRSGEIDIEEFLSKI